MKTKLILSCLALAGSTLFASAENANEAQAKIQAGMNKYCQAVLRHNDTMANEVLVNFFAPDYTTTDTHGKTMSFQEWKTGIGEEMKHLSKVSDIQIHCINFRPHGNTASSQEHFHMRAITKPMSPHQKAQILVVDTTSDVEFVKVGGKWKAHKSRDTQSKITLDGKPIQM